MRVRIHRGADEIGGNCIELEAEGERIVLDLGWPLTARPDDDIPLPDVAGLTGAVDPSLLSILISHPHPDHYGMLQKISSSVPIPVPIRIGAAAARILREAAFFTPGGIDLSPAGFLEHRKSFRLGPFLIRPHLNDHSAFDAYSLEIEAGGRRLFYTGDIRGHGRKRGAFEELLRDPPTGIDVMLMEGTQVRDDSAETDAGPSEADVERACVETFRKTRGMVLALLSPQNIDRLVTVFRACLQSGRDLAIDLYAASILAATQRDTIPQAEWSRVRVYLPRSQRSRVIREQAFHRTDAVRAHRIYPEELRERRGELVMLFRGSMSRELEQAGCLDDATAVWSMWPGYLDNPSGQRLQAFLDRLAIPLVQHHSSGHASIPDLQRLVTAIDPKRLVPIHSFAGDRFVDFFPRVDRQHDGVWWEV